MPDLITLLQQGNAALYIPSAILLGALHGLEPGHSKTMMAAFIIAIRGTLAQAVMLGISATISHTAVVWLVAIAGMYFGHHWSAEATEPYFQMASAAMIAIVGLWMLWRTWSHQHHHHDHSHDHHHSHDHEHDEEKLIHTSEGDIRIVIEESSGPARFRILPAGSGHALLNSRNVMIETVREQGAREQFSFERHGDYLESTSSIPEPHAFTAEISWGDGQSQHYRYSVVFEEHDHEHGLDLLEDEYQDAHELAHANDIRRRFSHAQVTNGQIILFGLTGGLIPCPASITVLLLCLQLKQVALGATLVLCFSIGLALTMVASGALAALSLKHVSGRWKGFGTFARKAPYFSGVLILMVATYLAIQGYRAL